jgi:phage-related minor tail protein
VPLVDATVEIVADYASFTPRLRAGLRKAGAAAGKEADRSFGKITDAAERAADAMAESYEDAAADVVADFKTASAKGAAALADLGDVQLALDLGEQAGRAVGDVVEAFRSGAERANTALESIGDGVDLSGLSANFASEADKATRAVQGMAGDVTTALGGLGGAGRAAGRELANGLESGLSGAKTAGRDAGKQLADGVEEGARGKVKFDRAFDDLDREAKQAGKEAGHSLADSLSSVLATAGIGAGLGASIAATMDIGKANDTLRAQLGATQEETAKYGKIAGDLFSQNYGESIGDVTTAMGTLIQQLPQLKTASQASLEDTTKDALNLSRVFGVDVTESTRAVASMLRTGVAKNADEAFAILTKGFQSGANQGDDLLDTFNEYSVQFQKLGLSGQDALGLINQMLAGGARNSDVAADGIKEFALQMQNGLVQTSAKGVTTTTALGKAFESMGLDVSAAAQKAGTGAFKLQDDIRKGGPAAKAAFGTILDGLKGIQDPTERSQAALALFGTKFEDLGNSVFAADLGTAATQVGDVSKATEGLNAEGSAASFDKFMRSLQTLGTQVGTTILPTLNALVDKLSGVTSFLEEHKDVAGPIVTGLLGIATASAGVKAISFGVNATGLPGAVKGVANLSRGISGLESAEGVMGKIGGGLRKLGGAGKTAEGGAGALSKIADKAKAAGSAMGTAGGAAADYGKKLGGAVASGAKIAANTAKLIAQKAVMVGLRIATGLFTAAQWLLNAAMAANPIGLIVIAIIALVAIIYICYKRFDSFRAIVDKAGRAIGAFAKWIFDGLKKAFAFVLGFYSKMLKFWTELPGKIVSWLGDIGGKLGGFLKKAWDKAYDTVVGFYKTMFKFWSGLLGKIIGWLGDVGGKLGGFLRKAWDKAYETVTGFYKKMFDFWTGLLGKILSWLGDVGGKLYDYLSKAFIRTFVAVGEFELKMLKFFTALVGKILGWIGDIGGKLADLFRRAMSAVGNAVSTGWQATANFFSGLGSKILGLLSSVGSAIATPFRNAFASAKDAVSGGIETVLGVIRGLPGKVGALAGKLYDAGKNLIGKFVSGLANLGTSAADFGSKVVGYVKSKLNSGIGKINGFIADTNDVIPGSKFDIPPIPTFARGGILDRATLAIVAEAGPEVIIPLTRPARAEELARQSGLLAMLELRGVLGAPAATSERRPAPPHVTGSVPVAHTVDKSVHIGELHVHHNGRDTEHATRKAIARAARSAMAGM